MQEKTQGSEIKGYILGNEKLIIGNRIPGNLNLGILPYLSVWTIQASYAEFTLQSGIRIN